MFKLTTIIFVLPSTAHQLCKLFLLLCYYRCCYVNNKICHNELAVLQWAELTITIDLTYVTPLQKAPLYLNKEIKQEWHTVKMSKSSAQTSSKTIVRTKTNTKCTSVKSSCNCNKLICMPHITSYLQLIRMHSEHV